MAERKTADRAGVLQAVVSILAPYVEPGALTRAAPEAIHLQTLDIPSADLIGVIIAIEDAFGIEIDDERLAELLTLDDVVRAVEAAVGGGP